MVHYPRQMRLLGPLINYWTMRQRLGHIVCNYQNILRTLANRQQMSLCYTLMSGKHLADRDVEIGSGSSTLVVSLERAEFLSTAMEVHLFSEVFVANWCVVNGIKYHKNVLIANGQSNDSFPIFEQILYIICVGVHVTLVTKPWQTVKYDRHTHSYVVQPTSESTVWSTIPVVNLLDRHVYHPAKSYREGDPYNYVTIRCRMN